MLRDTCPQARLPPKHVYDQMFPDQKVVLAPSRTILTAYDGSRIQGCVTLPFEYNGQQMDASFHVAETTGPAILGLPSSRNLQLVTLHYAMEAREMPVNTQPIMSTGDFKNLESRIKNLGILG